MAVPTLDALLAEWSTNFNTRGVADPTDFGLSAPQMAAYTPLHTTFISANNAAKADGSRSKALVVAKNDAKAALVFYARELYGIIQATPGVSNENKTLIGVHVRNAPSPVPPPAQAPVVTVNSVNGRLVRGNLRDATTQSSRRRPVNAKGALILTAHGPTPPASGGPGWTVQGQTGRTTFVAQFGNDVPGGVPCYISAIWYNERGEYSPASDPITVYVSAPAAEEGQAQGEGEEPMSIAA